MQKNNEHPFRETLTPRSLRREFQSCLAKYTSSDTRDQGLQGAITLIDANPTQINLFLACLSETRRVQSNLELELVTIGYLCQITNEDKQVLAKIMNLTLSYFNERKPSIQQAVCRVMVDLYRYSLLSESIEYQALILYSPLEQILLGGSQKYSQQTAAFCLSIFLQYLLEKKKTQFLKQICGPLTILFQKPQIEQPDLISALNLVSQGVNYENLLDQRTQQGVFDKIYKFFLLGIKQKQYSLQIYVNCCNLIICLCQAIDLNNLPFGLREQIQDQLYNLSSDSRQQVQLVAKEALTEFLKGLHVKLKDLRELRDQKKIEKLNNQQMENDSLVRNSSLYNLDFLSQDAKEIKGFGSQVRGSNFQRKGTGLGAGQAAADQVSLQKPKVDPFNKRIQNLYQQIAKPESVSPQQKLTKKNSNQKINSQQKNRIIEQEIPISESQLMDSLDDWKQIKKVQPVTKKKQQVSPQRKKVVEERKPVGQDNFIFKSQHFEMEESESQQEQQQFEKQPEAQQQNMQQSDLQTIEEVKEDDNKTNHDKSNDEKYLQISSYFNDDERNLANENEIDLKVEQLIQRNKEEIQQFQEEEVRQALVHQVNKNRKSKFSVDAITQPKRNYQDQIKNPPQRFRKEEPQPGQYENEKLDETHYNEINHKYPIPKEIAKKQISEDLQEIWLMALKFIQEDKLDSAYQMILQTEDDIYLIRLLSVSGPCIKSLSTKTARQLAERIKILVTSEFWKVLGTKYFEGLAQSEHHEKVTIEQRQRISQILYSWSGSWRPQISQVNANLYNSELFK